MSGRPTGPQSSYHHNRRPHSRRQWGWHRLQPDWAARVVAASPVRAGDLVLDIGAGTGALTEQLVGIGAHVIAVELNTSRADVLSERFGDSITVVRTDVRELRLPRRPFRVVASPPYAVSADVLRLLMSSDRLLSADLVLQRAAARRVAARPPARRHTSSYAFAVGLSVPRSAFVPPPRVDSAVLMVRHRSTIRR